MGTHPIPCPQEAHTKPISQQLLVSPAAAVRGIWHHTWHLKTCLPRASAITHATSRHATDTCRDYWQPLMRLSERKPLSLPSCIELASCLSLSTFGSDGASLLCESPWPHAAPPPVAYQSKSRHAS